MAAQPDKKTVIKDLLELGKSKGQLSTKEILDALGELDFDPEQIEKFYDTLESQGVEIVEEAVRAAREGAAANGLANCTFLAGDVLKVVDELREKPDIIVVDPPRDGIHPKALGKIIDFGVDRMVYISCKPTSLARDLAVLLERG